MTGVQSLAIAGCTGPSDQLTPPFVIVSCWIRRRDGQAPPPCAGLHIRHPSFAPLFPFSSPAFRPRVILFSIFSRDGESAVGGHRGTCLPILRSTRK